MTIETLPRPPSLVEAVSDKLAGIARQDHAANGRLPTERELSTQFGVSRSVIREAAKRLELQGLIEIRQGSGMIVVDKLHKPLSSALNLLVPDEKRRLAHLTEVRQALEPENARLAATRSTPAQIRALRQAQERLEQTLDFQQQIQADMDFHRLLAEASGNPISALLMHSLSDLMQASLAHGYSRVSPALAIKQHASILHAIEKRDPASATRAMQRHLHSASADLGIEPTD
jgi:DNA-binding FadR family transcriptional regulator